MSWEQLRDIAHEAVNDKRAREAQPPAACPFDGEPLKAASEPGVLFCPWGADHFTWPRDDAVAIR